MTEPIVASLDDLVEAITTCRSAFSPKRVKTALKISSICSTNWRTASGSSRSRDSRSRRRRENAGEMRRTSFRSATRPAVG